MSTDPFEHLDLQRELYTENWRETDRLHTPTIDVVLSDERTRLTFYFQDGQQKTLGRQDIEALARFLQENAMVSPLVADDSFLKDFHPRRVDE